MSKGSKARPFSVPTKVFDSNWDNIFGDKTPKFDLDNWNWEVCDYNTVYKMWEDTSEECSIDKMSLFNRLCSIKERIDAMKLLKGYEEVKHDICRPFYDQVDTIVLSKRDAEIFIDLINNPKEPNEAMKKAAKNIKKSKVVK